MAATAVSANAHPATPEMEALKTRLRDTWADGNYDYFSRFMESSAVEFLDRLIVDEKETVLDVACGSGQLALVAARRGIRTAGVDIAANAIAAARGRAEAEGLSVRFDVGDAEALPYHDGSFDVVASLFGAMFAPRPDVVSDELLRVCRPGGRIAMGNWTREGFIGQMLKTIGRFVAPPGMPSPLLWGDESTVRGRLGSFVSDLKMTRVNYRFNYPFAPAEVVEFFGKNYGPMTRAFGSLGAEQRRELKAELVALWSEHNRSEEKGRTIVDGEYLEVLAVTRTMYSLNESDDAVW
jgi:SAM-dependent methyltransferase